MQSSISTRLHLTQETFISCPITGIALTISFPACGIDFTYTSPFSLQKNITKICNLPSSSLYKLPKPVLAGILLSVLSHTELRSDVNISSTEANAFLQLATTATLISCIKTFHNIDSRRAAFLPRISLSSLRNEVSYSTAENILSNYLKTCREILNPTPTSINIISSSLPSHIKKVEVNTLTTELRKEAKNLVSLLSNDFLMSPKLLSVLRAIVSGNNLITTSDEIRDKIISRLEVFETIESTKLIRILRDCKSNAHLSETIKKEIVENEFGRISDEFEIVKQRKSLKEILEEKMKAKTLNAV